MKHATCGLMAVMLGLGMIAWSAGPAAADEGKPAGEKAAKEKKISLDEVPEAARNTILHEAAGNMVREIEQETENERTVYEAEWKVDGKEVEVKVTADGKLLERETEIALKDVPEAARETILKEAAGSKVNEVEKVVAGDRVAYEAEWKADGKEIEITVSTAGKVLKREVEEEDDDGDDDGDDDHKQGREEKQEDGEVDVTLDQVPDAVKATILKEAAGNKIEEIERETRNGRTVYEAEWKVGGKEIEINVAPDGTLLKKETEDDDDEDDDDDDDDDDDK